MVFHLNHFYLDKHQLVLKYLKNTEVNIHNILVMTENSILGTEIGICLTLIIQLIVISL